MAQEELNTIISGVTILTIAVVIIVVVAITIVTKLINFAIQLLAKDVAGYVIHFPRNHEGHLCV